MQCQLNWADLIQIFSFFLFFFLFLLLSLRMQGSQLEGKKWGLKKKKFNESVTETLQPTEFRQSQSSNKIRTRPIPRKQYEVLFLVQKAARGYQFKGNAILGFIRPFYTGTAKVQTTLRGKHHENQCTDWRLDRWPWFTAINFAVLYFPSHHLLHSWRWRTTEEVECACQVICFPFPAK